MNRAVLIAGGVAVGVAAFVAMRRESGQRVEFVDMGGMFDGVIEGFMDVADGVKLKLDRTFNFVAVGNMRKLVPHIEQVRAEKNVRAFLHVIRHKEHYPSVAHTNAAYNVIVGGKTFSSYADHPRIVGARTKQGPSTAAGAYQVTATTWDWVRSVVGKAALPDFSPANQERAALYLIAYRGGLELVRAGKVLEAAKVLRNEWASLPGAIQDRGYTTDEVLSVFNQYGGTTALA